MAVRCMRAGDSVCCLAHRLAETLLNLLQVAEALMSASVPPGSCMARIMLFTGGPGTEGLGKVIGRDLTEEIRRCVMMCACV
jgi:hypothetical protein